MTAGEALRDDTLNVILTMLLVRIPAFREKGTDHRSRSVPIFRFRLLVSEANVSNAIFLGCSKPSACSGSWIGMLKQVQMRRAGCRLRGIRSREEKRQSIQVSMQLRKLSRHRLLEVPLIVIPNSFRDLGVNLIQGRLFPASSGSRDDSPSFFPPCRTHLMSF